VYAIDTIYLYSPRIKTNKIEHSISIALCICNRGKTIFLS